MKKLTLLLCSLTLFASVNLSTASTGTEPVKVGKNETLPGTEVVLDDVVATDAMREFRSLSRVDRKMRLREAKTKLKELKAMKAAGEDVSTNTVLLAILAVLLPPLAVGLHEHDLNGKFWLSVLLTLLFWLPGVIYALIVVLS